MFWNDESANKPFYGKLNEGLDIMHQAVHLRDYRESYLFFSLSPEVKKAIVFVHGFLGDSLETWYNFQTLVDKISWWNDADLYFFAYDSFGRSIPHSAEDLSRFLASVCSPPRSFFEVPSDELPEWLPRDGGLNLRDRLTQYEEYFLVGHSQGGVVLRQALLELVKDYHERSRAEILEDRQSADVDHPSGTMVKPATSRALVKSLDTILGAHLRLFAPALLGARPARVYALAMRLGGLRMLSRLFLGYSPSYSELQQNSKLLALIREGTERFADRYDSLLGLRADILWAEKDDVVLDAAYLCDRIKGRIDNKRHTSVCKPTTTYMAPVRFVSDGQP